MKLATVKQEEKVTDFSERMEKISCDPRSEGFVIKNAEFCHKNTASLAPEIMTKPRESYDETSRGGHELGANLDCTSTLTPLPRARGLSNTSTGIVAYGCRLA